MPKEITVAYISRAGWGARPPAGSRNALDPKPLGSGIHWNGPGCAASLRTHDKCAPFLRGIQNFHMGPQRGWSDIAYSVFVCPHGDVFEGRGKNVGTAAFGTNHGNRYYYAIYAMWGQGDGPAPAAMLDGITEAVALCRSWGAGSQVIGHRDENKGTECPGDELYRLVHAGRFSKATTPTKTTTTSSSLRATWLRKPIAEHGNLSVGTVKRLQAEVDVAIDGQLGPQTKKAVQRWLGVTADGEWGPKTYAAMRRKVGATNPTGGWTKDLGKALQRHLNALAKERRS